MVKKIDNFNLKSGGEPLYGCGYIVYKDFIITFGDLS